MYVLLCFNGPFLWHAKWDSIEWTPHLAKSFTCLCTFGLFPALILQQTFAGHLTALQIGTGDPGPSWEEDKGKQMTTNHVLRKVMKTHKRLTALCKHLGGYLTPKC